jgi:hypothetical protein
VLHGDAELPVVVPDAPPVLHVGVDARGPERDAEVEIVPDAAVVTARRQIVLPAGFIRSQSGTKLPLPSVQLRVVVC